MDPRTLSYYERHAAELAERDERRASSGISRYFPLAFGPPRRARVLDVGAGTGRDAALLARAGYDVRAIEPSAALRDVALERHAELRERLLPGSLPDALPQVDALEGPFDGVLCSAVLQHLPRHALFDAVSSLRGLLSPRGRVLVSIPASSGGTSAAADDGRILDAEHRDPDGRLYTPIDAAELRLLFERCGFATIGSWQDPDALGRPGLRWHTLLFELAACSLQLAARSSQLVTLA